MAPTSATVASWALGLLLRQRREDLGLSGAAAAKQFGITAAYLSEVETGKKNLSEERLGALLEWYEFDPEEADELRSFRDQANHHGWWSNYSAMFGTDLLKFFGFEHGAESVHSYDGGLIHGLLQTEEYTRAIIEAGPPNLRLAEVDRRVRCRMTRQHRLTGEDPLLLSAIMSEAALRQQVGGPKVLKAQLERLADLIDRLPDTLEVRVVPFEATGCDALGASTFHIMTFPSGKLPKMLWQESVTSTQLTNHELVVREYSLAHKEAARVALTREDSLALIRKRSECL